MNAGVENIIGCDSKGAIYKGRTENMNFMKDWYADNTNPEGVRGGLTEAVKGANLFLGLSGPGTFSVDQLKTMAKDPIVFAMANPTPEIMPEVAAPYVRVMATGRSDYPNQINNVLAFPGIFKGALACRATQISEGMKVAAAEAIAACIRDDELNEDYIIPSVFNRNVAPTVAEKVIEVAQAEGLARRVPGTGRGPARHVEGPPATRRTRVSTTERDAHSTPRPAGCASTCTATSPPTAQDGHEWRRGADAAADDPRAQERQGLGARPSSTAATATGTWSWPPTAARRSTRTGTSTWRPTRTCTIQVGPEVMRGDGLRRSATTAARICGSR